MDPAVLLAEVSRAYREHPGLRGKAGQEAFSAGPGRLFLEILTG